MPPHTIAEIVPHRRVGKSGFNVIPPGNYGLERNPPVLKAVRDAMSNDLQTLVEIVVQAASRRRASLNLTQTSKASSLPRMGLARPILFAVLTVAVAAYASDCGGLTTPEQAMQCCNSMRCSSHGHHGQECCNSMPAIHAAVGQPSSVQGISFSPVGLGVVWVFGESHSIKSSARMIAEQSHAPPPFGFSSVLPLRI